MKISIVTPSFNQAAFLEDTIKSVIDQNYEDLEYVVIDGGSTDGSKEIIRKYEDMIDFSISEKDNGHADALNKGFSKTSGEIMAWLNSDDMYLPWTFKIVNEIFTQFPQVNWIVGFNAWWSSHGALTAAMRVPKNVFDFLEGNYKWIQQESVFWRRSLWEKAGGHINESYKFMIDGELWSRFFLYDDLYSVDSILSGYRVHSTNRAHCNADICEQEMTQAIKVLKENCSEEILEKLDVLKLSENKPMIDFNYKNIHFSEDKWQIRQLPYGNKWAIRSTL